VRPRAAGGGAGPPGPLGPRRRRRRHRRPPDDAGGGAAIRRSVFRARPGEGRWGAVLLVDGNVGIGGDPAALLRRCRALACPDGRVLVELEAPGTGCATVRTRLERGVEVTAWFDWAHVGVDAVAGPAARAGLRVEDTWSAEDRWFASLTS
jgi:hypothetical protein